MRYELFDLPERVQAGLHRLMRSFGINFASIDIQPFDLECTFPEKELIRYLTRLGPVGMALQQADDQTRARVIGVARAAFEPYVHGADVHFTAACWIIEARAGA